MIWFSLLVLLLTLSAQAATPTLFTHMSPKSERDPRVTYDRELLRLALEKTRASHGDFQLRAAPPHDIGQDVDQPALQPLSQPVCHGQLPLRP